MTLVPLGHHIVFVFHKVMVKVDVMGPDLPLIREADLLSISYVVGDGVVVDIEVLGGCYGCFGVKDSVD